MSQKSNLLKLNGINRSKIAKENDESITHYIPNWVINLKTRIIKFLFKSVSGLLLSIFITLYLILNFISFVSPQTYLGINQSFLSYQNNLISLSAKLGLGLKSLELVGRIHLDRQAITEVLGLVAGTPLLAINVEETKQNLLQFGWIKSAQVNRVWPNQLRIEIQERSPVAIWQYQSNLYLIDHEGNLIANKPKDKFDSLPLISGQGAQLRNQQITDLLQAYPLVQERYVAASLIGERQWVLYLNPDISIKLPTTGFKIALERFLKIMDENKSLWNKIKSVDLRLEDRIVILPLLEAEPSSKSNNDDQKLNPADSEIKCTENCG